MPLPCIGLPLAVSDLVRHPNSDHVRHVVPGWTRPSAQRDQIVRAEANAIFQISSVTTHRHDTG